ncbi:response regulator transcription factor [Christiangramia crocea]|uniref:LuxR C-terminal-related transcriptional regulator n=1 Tax=Christiangramia crocea TaxID=2904124 RepID=A0A9X1UUQ0_9FLAO|nr:LuxR C-terminal-related transcriptional regulator [Gramella crocea]MCG9970614.1 LuxR C-terminal-related transcriptional regulator [Gramella crocea]
MKIYESDYLIIQFEKENDRFVQFWKSSPASFKTLKVELLNYTGLYEKYRPSQALWLQQHFSLPLDKQMDEWIETNVNIPCVENGNEKVAFVVGKDVLVHLSVINSFEETSSIVNHNHFASEKEAREWLDESDTAHDTNSEITILFEGIDENGNSIIKIKRPSGDIFNTIKSFSNLIEENKFIKSNIEKYSKLTKREKEILVIFSKGLKQQEIADELFISIQTLRTHWKNIKKKLEIKSLTEVVKYVQAFEMK